jgi:hypothetical protein
LLHSYTFSSSKISDSVVGDASEGFLNGGATVSGGQAHFTNQDDGLAGSYISLPFAVTGVYKVITIELWANLSAVSGDDDLTTLFFFGQASTSSVRCSVKQSDGKIACRVCSIPASCSTLTSSISFSSTSVHLVATFDALSGSMSLSVNSLQQGSSAFSSQLPDSGASDFEFYLGASPSTFNELSFLGSLDEFRVWAGSIPAFTITSHFENGPTPHDTGSCEPVLV